MWSLDSQQHHHEMVSVQGPGHHCGLNWAQSTWVPQPWEYSLVGCGAANLRRRWVVRTRDTQPPHLADKSGTLKPQS
ncbi:MAG: hypothetical protein WBW98_08880, partial [Candidatus Sulfotelmatobacter sp.]